MMNFEKKTIEEATAAEMRDFARNYLQIAELSDREGKPVMLGKLQAAGWVQDFIFLTPSADAAPIAPKYGSSERPRLKENGDPVIGPDGEPETETYIRIPNQEKIGGYDGVPVSKNGSRMVIPRNQDVWVPTKFLECLDHAVSLEYAPTEDGLDEPAAVPQYPYILVQAA